MPGIFTLRAEITNQLFETAFLGGENWDLPVPALVALRNSPSTIKSGGQLPQQLCNAVINTAAISLVPTTLAKLMTLPWPVEGALLLERQPCFCKFVLDCWALSGCGFWVCRPISAEKVQRWALSQPADPAVPLAPSLTSMGVPGAQRRIFNGLNK